MRSGRELGGGSGAPQARHAAPSAAASPSPASCGRPTRPANCRRCARCPAPPGLRSKTSCKRRKGRPRTVTTCACACAACVCGMSAYLQVCSACLVCWPPPHTLREALARRLRHAWGGLPPPSSDLRSDRYEAMLGFKAMRRSLGLAVSEASGNQLQLEPCAQYSGLHIGTCGGGTEAGNLWNPVAGCQSRASLAQEQSGRLKSSVSSKGAERARRDRLGPAAPLAQRARCARAP